MRVSDYKMSTFGGSYWVRFLGRHSSDKLIIFSSGVLKPDFKIPFSVIFKPSELSTLEEMIADGLREAPGGLRREAG